MDFGLYYLGSLSKLLYTFCIVENDSIGKISTSILIKLFLAHRDLFPNKKFHLSIFQYSHKCFHQPHIILNDVGYRTEFLI